jgi:hypothetical protein
MAIDMRESLKTQHTTRSTPAQDACGIEARGVAQSRARDRRSSCISQGLRVPREAWEYRIDLLSTPAFRPGQLLRPRAGSKGSRRPPVTCAQPGLLGTDDRPRAAPDVLL